jgi:O-antigen ligase
MLEEVLSIKEYVLELLGRDATLTTRVPMWEFLTEMCPNAFIGAGYYSFWLGERLLKIWDHIGIPLNQAHNGYLEQYLNLGYIGLIFIGIIVISGLVKVNRELRENYYGALLSLCFIFIALLYNYTEAAFYGISNMWLILLFSVIDVPSSKGSKLPGDERKYKNWE